MATISSINVDLNAKTIAFQEGFAQALNKMRDFKDFIPGVQSQLSGLMSAVGTVGGGIAGAFAFSSIIEAASGAETTMVKLNAVVKATGQTARLSAKQMADFAGELSKTSNFGKGAILKAETALAVAGSVSGANFKETIKVAQDLAAIFDGDLTSATETLAKALAAPSEAFSILRRAGVALTTQQQEAIENFSDLGDTVGAQREILKDLEQHVGGVAEAMKNTFEGRVAQARREIEATGKKIGEALLPMLKAIIDNSQTLIPIIGAVGAAYMAFNAIQMAVATGEAIVLALSGPVGWATLVVAAGIATVAYVGLKNAFKEVTDNAKAASTSFNAGPASGAAEEVGAKVKQLKTWVEELRASANDFGLSADQKKLADFSKLPQTTGVKAAEQEARWLLTVVEHKKEQLEIGKKLIELQKEATESAMTEAEKRRDSVASMLEGLHASAGQVANAMRLVELAEAGKRLAADRETANKMHEDLASPFEKATKQITDLKRLFAEGLLNPTEFARAGGSIIDELRKATNQPAIKGFQAGSMAAAEEEFRIRNAGQTNPLVDLAKQQLQVAQQGFQGVQQAVEAIEPTITLTLQ